MITREKLTKAYLDWFGIDNTFAITFVYNRNSVSLSEGAELLREFHRRVDEKRLGGRYYQYPEEDRLRFRVVPEKWDAHPHCHGIIRLDADRMTREELGAHINELEAIWRDVAPGGSLKINRLSRENPEGWLRYASKEHDLLDGAYALDSLESDPKRSWRLNIKR